MARKPTRRTRRKPRTTLLQRLRTDFLTGLVVVLPMFLTVYLVWLTIGFVDSRVVPLIPRAYNPENIFGRNIFGLGVLVFVSFTTLVGAIAKGYIGRHVLQFGEGLVERTPVVRSVYNGLKQIVETLFNQSGTTFRQACLVEYPRKGLWAVAFVAADTRGEIPAKAGEDDMVSVFLPTTPNPTSGFLLFVPRRDMIPLEMSLEDAAKLVISFGLVSPPTAAAMPPPAVTPLTPRAGGAAPRAG
jgi:uncharacterized membrane protein